MSNRRGLDPLKHYVPADPGTGRPSMPGAHAELYDTFLAPNGVDGLIPENAEITVKGGRMTWPAWRMLPGAANGWDSAHVMVRADIEPNTVQTDRGGDPITDPRSAPVRAPVTDRVRELARMTGLRLVER